MGYSTTLAAVLGGGLSSAALAVPIPGTPAGSMDVGTQPACLRVRTPVAAATVPDSADFERAACDRPAVAPAFRYDTAVHATRTTRALLQGDIVPLYPEFGMNMIRPGEILDLVAQSGPVRIVRKVEALQSARSGERLFVKSSDGQVFSVRYEAVAP